MTMKLKQSKKNNSMGSGVLSPMESQAISSPQAYTADNSPERQPKANHMLKRQFSTTQNNYLKSLPYHRYAVCPFDVKKKKKKPRIYQSKRIFHFGSIIRISWRENIIFKYGHVYINVYRYVDLVFYAF